MQSMPTICPRCRNPFPLHWTRHVSNYSTATVKYYLCGHCIHEEESEIQATGGMELASEWAMKYHNNLLPLRERLKRRKNKFVYFRVTVPGAEGSIDDVRVQKALIDAAKQQGEKRKLVALAAWSKLLHEQDPYTRQKLDSNHRRMLEQIISKVGYDQAKALFVKRVTFEIINL
jgi:hypothetical protein